MEQIIGKELIKLSDRVFSVFVPEENILRSIRLPNLSIVSETDLNFESDSEVKIYIEEYNLIQEIKSLPFMLGE